MKEVPVSIVKKVWGKMNKMSPLAAAKLMEQMGREQPNVLVYLGSVDEESLNEGERGIMTFLGMTIWQALRQAAGTLPEVGEEAMHQAEAETLKRLESLAPESEDGSAAIINIIRACGQGELMDLALDVLLEASGDEDDEEKAAGAALSTVEMDPLGPLVRAENVSLIMLNLKTVVDVLSA
jgi:hypothetical protein